MNMRYGSYLNPKWIMDGLWRKRKVVFFVISAASLAGNAVVLAESSGIHKTVVSGLQQLLRRLQDTGEVLGQRHLFYILLNLIMLGMVAKSVVLGERRWRPVHEADTDGRVDSSMLFPETLDDHPAASSEDQALSMKWRDHAVFFFDAELTLNSNLCAEQGVARTPTRAPARLPKRASLFTIEPLDSCIEPPSNAVMLAPPIVAAAAQHQKWIDSTAPNSHAPKEPKIRFPPSSHDSAQNGVSHKNSAPDHPNNRDYQDLNRQEVNERVETFITKFKRNLSMQRQDSFDRLLGLVGEQIIGHRS